MSDILKFTKNPERTWAIIGRKLINIQIKASCLKAEKVFPCRPLNGKGKYFFSAASASQR
jgi:hypothetical protein